MSRAVQVVFILSTFCLSWLSMMAVHESGHVIHAHLSGGTVSDVVLPVIGFSRTDLLDNPNPLFVAWGGPIWGCLIPLVALCVVKKAKARYWYVLQFFTGFCLIANGAYLGVGSFIRAGDAGDLMRYGSPQWFLVAFGVVTIPGAFWLWNGLGKHFGLGVSGGRVDRRTMVGTLAVNLMVLIGFALFG